MAKMLITLPEDVHQALRIAAIVGHEHQYVLVTRVLREYLEGTGHLKGGTQEKEKREEDL